jgi:hypothetical protein
VRPDLRDFGLIILCEPAVPAMCWWSRRSASKRGRPYDVAISRFVGDGRSRGRWTDRHPDRGIRSTILHADGGYKRCIQPYLAAGRAAKNISTTKTLKPTHHFRMDGKTVFENGAAGCRTRSHCVNARARGDRCLIPHRHLRMLEAILQRTAFPARKSMSTGGLWQHRFGFAAHRLRRSVGPTRPRRQPVPLVAFGSGFVWDPSCSYVGAAV